MIGATIGSMVLAGVLTTYMMLMRSGVRAQNYAVMEAQTRQAFEQLGIDARMASEMTSTDATGDIGVMSTRTSVTLTVPNNYTSTNNKVTYGYDPTNKLFYLVPGDGRSSGQMYVAPGTGTAPTGQRILIGKTGNASLNLKVTTLTFARYDQTGNAIPATTTSDATTKHIQVSVNVQGAASGTVAANESIVSASFTMRNISL
jgi:Tfp pilus assembly protein PilW